MVKIKYFSVLFLLLLVSCVDKHHSINDTDYNCIEVSIPRSTAYVVQKVNYKNDFQIEVVGYSAHCYFDTRINRRKAVITPQFVVKRLRGDLDETDVDFEYYTQTIKGPPEYLGQKQYFGRVVIPLDKKEVRFSGSTLELKIPNQGYEDFEVNLGLVLTSKEQQYNNRTFDIN